MIFDQVKQSANMFMLTHNIPFQEGLINHMRYLMEYGSYSDMKLVIMNGIKISLHKAIVGLLIPTSILDNSNTIHMDFVTEDVGSALSQLIYTGKSSLQNEEELCIFEKIAKNLKFSDKVSITKSEFNSFLLETSTKDKMDPPIIKQEADFLAMDDTMAMEDEEPDSKVPLEVIMDNEEMDDTFTSMLDPPDEEEESFMDLPASDGDDSVDLDIKPLAKKRKKKSGKLKKRGRGTYISREERESYKKFPCPECEERFLSFIDLADHVTEAHPHVDLTKCDIDRLPFHCDTCEKKFSTHVKLNSHKREHEISGEIKCTVEGCEETFLTMDKKRSHMRKHARENRLNGVTVPKKRSYKHGMLYLKDPKNSVQCPQCGGTYSSKQRLLVHCKTMHPDVPYEDFKKEMDAKFKLKCKYCDREYSKKETLRDHERTVHESTDENVPCEVCGKSFKSKAKERGHYYSAHFYAHKRTTVSRRLKDPHLYYNMETMECKTCKKIVDRQKIKEHYMRFHAPNQPVIPCTECDSTFKDKYNLKQHIEFKHREWDVPCGICDKKLPNRAERVIHLKKNHKVNLLVMCTECRVIKGTSKMKYHKCSNGTLENIMVRIEQ